MAHHKSAKKRIRQNEKRRVANQFKRSTMRTFIKSVREAVSKKDKPTAATALKTAVSYLDVVSRKGLIHKNTAARYISRLTKAVNGITE